ncbi:glutathione S-transferase family protein [Parvibaculaceae bacterium PLY_AMNH_Bact1]|nr:glutathione S-transferase family protein [Parvibaculaceae bacterium PLY_AMNH_Bact1]
MLKIFHVPGTRSVRPLWLCFELGLEFEIVPIDFSPAYRDSLEWRSISPAGKVPALTDGEVNMFESGAMLEFILDRYGDGRLRPEKGTPESAEYLQWSWFAEATLSRPLGFMRAMKLVHAIKQGKEEVDVIAAEGEKKARSALEAVEQRLADREFLVGTGFTAADIMTGYSLDLLSHVYSLDESYPKAAAYLGRLKAREACKKAIAA